MFGENKAHRVLEALVVGCVEDVDSLARGCGDVMREAARGEVTAGGGVCTNGCKSRRSEGRKTVVSEDYGEVCPDPPSSNERGKRNS